MCYFEHLGTFIMQLYVAPSTKFKSVVKLASTKNCLKNFRVISSRIHTEKTAASRQHHNGDKSRWSGIQRYQQ